MVSCSTSNPSVEQNGRFTPSAVIDLGALVTEQLPEHFWGKAFLKQMNFTKQNSFEVIRWEFPMEAGTVSGSNGYYTLFNHGGPHVDAPSHMGEGGGIDSYSIEAFSGPVKVFDARSHALGRSVPANIFQGRVQPGDIVLIFTGYTSPQ
jgi:kynurenine formamidase